MLEEEGVGTPSPEMTSKGYMNWQACLGTQQGKSLGSSPATPKDSGTMTHIHVLPMAE